MPASAHGLPFFFGSLTVRFGKIVVIEWLRTRDRKTGFELVEWMRARGFDAKRRIEYRSVASGKELLEVLRGITAATDAGEPWPLIHIETHGERGNLEIGKLPRGYFGPDGSGGEEHLSWTTLTPYFVQLNRATRCNLQLVSASCWGQAAVFAATETSRVPFVACIGFSTKVSESSVLDTTKEFYRRLFDGTTAEMSAAVDSAARELDEDEGLEWDSIPLLTYEAIEQGMREKCSPDIIRERALDLAMRLVGPDNYPLISALPYSTAVAQLHQGQAEAASRVWNMRFMIDLFPENEERFRVDIDSLMCQIMDEAYGLASAANPPSSSDDSPAGPTN
jgi:hypothetical protein